MNLKKLLGYTVTLGIISSASAQDSSWSVCPAALDIKTYPDADKWALIAGRGKGDWIFGQSSFIDYASIQTNMNDLKSFSELLRSRGTELIMVFIPPKGVTSFEQVGNAIPAGIDIAKLKSNYNQYVEQVNSIGIFSPNILKAKENDSTGIAYDMMRDHHWSSHAGQVTANIIAEHLNKLPMLENIPTIDFKSGTINVSTAGSFGAIVTRFCNQSIPKETYVAPVATTVKNDLISDDPRIVVVGTSNTASRNGEESFVTALKLKTKRDVTNASVLGGGSITAIETYITSREFIDNPPSVLIWETNSPIHYQSAIASLLPAVKGVCEKPLYTAQSILPSSPIENLKTDDGDYLVITPSDTTLKVIPLTLSKAGSNRSVNVVYQPKTPVGRPFFLQIGKDITSIKVNLQDSAGRFSIKLCR